MDNYSKEILSVLKEMQQEQKEMYKEAQETQKRITILTEKVSESLSIPKEILNLSPKVITGDAILHNDMVMRLCYGVSLDPYEGINAQFKRIGNNAGFPIQKGITIEVIDGQEFARVPSFFFAQFVEKGIYYFLVSRHPLGGFIRHPWFSSMDGYYMEQFFGSHEARIDNQGRLCSVKGDTTTNKTREEFRQAARLRGNDYYQQSYVALHALQLLYITERAIIDTLKDTMVDNFHGINWIFSGNWKFIDGINVFNNKAYVFTDHRFFADDTSENADTCVDLPAEDGYVDSITMSDLGIFPKTVITKRNDSTFKSSYWQNSGWRVLLSGGVLDYGAFGGIASFYASYASSYGNVYFGSRLCKDGRLIEFGE